LDSYIVEVQKEASGLEKEKNAIITLWVIVSVETSQPCNENFETINL
jgi:hypothetical protein